MVSLTPMGRRKEQEENRIQAKKMEAVLTMASALAVRFEEYCTEVLDQVRRLKGEAPAGDVSMGRVIRALEAISADALRMTGSLKTIARKEAAFPDARRFDFRAVVKEAIAMGRSDWERRSADDPGRFRVKTYLRSGSHILGDAEALRDVIARLIQNALEAMPGGGDLYVTSEENEGAAHLYIMDNGVGVSDTVRDRIFDPFFTTRQDGGAAGLGLSVAYAVIRQHGGEIEVTSETSQGTEIHISVPLAPPEQTVASQSPTVSRKPSRILVIGAASPLQDLFFRVFSSRGWEVAASESAAEALARLRGESWGMAILEHPGNGLKRSLSICRRIKALDPGLPVVLIVGNGAGDAAAGRPGEPGVVDLVARKPLHMERFQAQVQGLLAGVGTVAG